MPGAFGFSLPGPGLSRGGGAGSFSPRESGVPPLAGAPEPPLQAATPNTTGSAR
jgi:hypothetical protein